MKSSVRRTCVLLLVPVSVPVSDPRVMPGRQDPAPKARETWSSSTSSIRLSSHAPGDPTGHGPLSHSDSDTMDSVQVSGMTSSHGAWFGPVPTSARTESNHASTCLVFFCDNGASPKCLIYTGFFKYHRNQFQLKYSILF